MTDPRYLLVVLLFPVAGGLLTAFLKPLVKDERRKVFVSAVLLVELALMLPVLRMPGGTIQLFCLSDDLPVFLNVDPLGKVFAGLMSFVWCAAGMYSFEYMEHEAAKARYYGFYLATLGVLMGLCFAGSIVTFYMFYELMTLLTVPLVMHTMTREAVAAGIKYLIYSVLGASLVLLGVFMLSPFVTGFAFTAGGVLDAAKMSGHEGFVRAVVFLMMLGFGAKAGMYPLHGWLPTAHPAAPAPASAVLSGVITKAGVLGTIRLVYCFVGVRFLRGSWVQTTILCIALFTVFMGSLLAYREGLLKKRLAWSSVSQLSYILFGISTMHPLGLIGALLHVFAHSLIKDTLFMAAGAIIHKTGKVRVDELEGIGKQMPVTMWCFTLAGIGLVGIPPCMGFVSKWYLAQGSLSMSGVPAVLTVLGPAVLLISALLTAGYLLPISIRGFFPGKGEDGSVRIFEKCEPRPGMLIPLMILTVLSILLGMFPGMLTTVFARIAAALM